MTYTKTPTEKTRLALRDLTRPKSPSNRPPLQIFQEATASFADHFAELKRRFFLVIIAFLIASSVGYALHNRLISWILRPLNQPLFYTHPTGGFTFIFNLSFLFGLLIIFPLLLYQIIKFIEPALSIRLRYRVYSIILLSYVLLLVGMGLAYSFSLPLSLKALESFQNAQLKSLISTDEYLSFVSIYLVGFALVFQMPLVLLIINHYRRLEARQMMSYQRWVILISFIVAAILNPAADVLSQTLMALPGIILFQFSMLTVIIVNRYHRPSKR